MAELDDLTAQAQANHDLEESAVLVINGLAAKITAAGTDPAKLQALTTELKGSATDLAAAIVANTPADPGTGTSTSGTGGAPAAGGAPTA